MSPEEKTIFKKLLWLIGNYWNPISRVVCMVKPMKAVIFTLIVVLFTVIRNGGP